MGEREGGVRGVRGREGGGRGVRGREEGGGRGVRGDRVPQHSMHV